MKHPSLTSSDKPCDIHERLLLFACDIVRVTQFLHTRGTVKESDELVRIISAIVHEASRRRAEELKKKREGRDRRGVEGR